MVEMVEASDQIGEEKKPLIDIRNVPAPHKIKGRLDEYVVGQDLIDEDDPLLRFLHIVICRSQKLRYHALDIVADIPSL